MRPLPDHMRKLVERSIQQVEDGSRLAGPGEQMAPGIAGHYLHLLQLLDWDNQARAVAGAFGPEPKEPEPQGKVIPILTLTGKKDP